MVAYQQYPILKVGKNLMEQEKSRSPTKLSKLLCQLRLKIAYYSIKESVLAILLIVMIMIFRLVPRRASAQSSDCSSTIISLAPCLNYITGSSDTPDVPCCTQLAKVVQSAPKCLCLILDGGASQFGVTLNATKALALPGACNVQTPPVSRCKDVSSPAPAPGSGSDSAPGKTSRGSFLQPVALPILFSVIFIILAGFSMHYISF